MIAQGLGFTLGLLILSVVLNGALSWWMLRQHYYLLAGVYGAVAFAVIAFFGLIWLRG